MSQMIISIRKNHIPHAVFGYEFEARTVFVGSSPMAEIHHVGKHCQLLDVEYQRRLGTPEDEWYFGEPSIQIVIYQSDLSDVDAAKNAAVMQQLLKPVWGSGYDYALAKRRNPHIMHVETGAVFETAHAAALAMQIGSTHAYNIIDRPMLTSGTGRKPVGHLVTTTRPVTHRPHDKRWGGLDDWRAQNDY